MTLAAHDPKEPTMKWHTLALIMLSVSLSALAQIVLKYGMSSVQAQRALVDSKLSGLAIIATSPHVLSGFALYGLGAVLWLGVLARIEVSQAYPFVGLGFLMTMAFAIAFLGEAFSIPRLAGSLLITAGVVLVARS